MKCPLFAEVVVQDKSWREGHDFVRTWRIGAVDALPQSHMSYLALYPRLHGDYYGKLNTFLDQILDKVSTEKPAVGPKSNSFDVGRKLLDKALNKINRLVATVVFAAPQHTSNVISGFTHKTQQGMVTLSSLLLGIVTQCSPLLIAIDRNHMRVQVKGDLPQTPVLLPQLHDKIKVQSADLVGHRYPHTGQKSAHSGLNRETTQSHYLLKYLVCAKYLHLVGPAITEQHPVQTPDNQGTCTVFAFSATFYLHLLIYHLLNLMPLKESSDQPNTTKTSQVATSELFLYPDNLSFAFRGLLRYTLFHLLSASFVVLVVSSMPFYYYIWRHFCLENYTVNA